MPDVEIGDATIHYEETGSGDPLVLLMGLGADGSLWAEHVETWAPHFRAIMIDNRGSGRSSKPPGPYTTSMMADDAAALMDALGVSAARVAGVSMGGAIAQELAIRRPDLVRSLVLSSTWPKTEPVTARVFATLKRLVTALRSRAFVRMLQLWVFAPAYHKAHPDDVLRREEEALAAPYPMPPEAFASQCDACITHDALDRIDRIDCPTLVTVGDKDILTPPHYSETLAERIPEATLEVFAGGAHGHYMEMVERYNALVLDFLRRT